MMPGFKIRSRPTKPDHWPEITRTDLNFLSLWPVARTDEAVMIASRPCRFINLDLRFLTMSSDGKVALFIDGANLYATAKALGFDIDYGRLLKHIPEPRSIAARLLLRRQLSQIRSTRPPAH